MRKVAPCHGFDISRINIWYLQPYSVCKNIGAEYNRQIERLPSQDWICITDHDMMFLHPESKMQIYDVARAGEYDLYGCLTNRLASIKQAPFVSLFDEPDIRKHIEVAEKLHTEKYGVVEPTSEAVAGMFMLFRKQTWEQVGGFRQNSIIFDRQFSEKIEKKGLITGLYVFHLYRFGQNDPKHYVKHLL